MRGADGDAGLQFVELLAHHLDDRRQLGVQRFRVGEPDRDRIGVEEEIGVAAKAFLQLLVDAIARAMADDRAELQSLFARLPEQQRYVGIVAGVEDHVGASAFQFRHQRGKIRRCGGIAFLHDDIEAGLLRARLVALCHVNAIGAILVNDGDPQILRLLAELLFRVLRDVVRRHHPELIAARLRTEHVFVVLVLEHGGRDAGGHPHELLQLLDPRGHRHALGGGEEAEHHVDLFLLQQTHRLVDRDVGLALGVGINSLDLVTLDAGLGVVVEHDLHAGILQLGAAAGERAGQVKDHAYLDLLLLSIGGRRNAPAPPPRPTAQPAGAQPLPPA